MIITMICVLIERIKEIRKGENDDPRFGHGRHGQECHRTAAEEGVPGYRTALWLRRTGRRHGTV